MLRVERPPVGSYVLVDTWRGEKGDAGEETWKRFQVFSHMHDNENEFYAVGLHDPGHLQRCTISKLVLNGAAGEDAEWIRTNSKPDTACLVALFARLVWSCPSEGDESTLKEACGNESDPLPDESSNSRFHRILAKLMKRGSCPEDTDFCKV